MMRKFFLHSIVLLNSFFLFSQNDSVQIFYERHNSTVTISLTDYKQELQLQLGEKSKSYLSHLDTLIAGSKGKKLYLRAGFWQASSSYEKIDFPLLEQTLLVLFVSEKARLTQKGINYKLADVETKEKDFYVCDKKKNGKAGVMVYVIAIKKKSVLLTVPKNVTKEFLEKDWCE